MFNHSQTLELYCDAPAYPIVEACRMIGIRDPEDVRWSRLSHRHQAADRRPDLFNPRSWKVLLKIGRPPSSGCHCGHPLPRLEKYTFTLLGGRQLDYFIGQCPRCRTVYWEEP